MKKIKLLLFFLAVFTGLQAQTNVSGTISSNTTWLLSGSPYILTSSVSVQGVMLTIEPGAVVQTQGNTIEVRTNRRYESGKYVSYYGKLQADGVSFTSPNTRSNASQINFEGINETVSGSNAVIPHYAGGTLKNCIFTNVKIVCRVASDPSITGSTFTTDLTNERNSGICLSSDDGSIPSWSGNLISGYQYAFSISDESQPIVSGNDIAGCATNYTALSGTFDADYTLRNNGYPYQLTGSLSISGASFAISSGLTIDLKGNTIDVRSRTASSILLPGKLSAAEVIFFNNSSNDESITAYTNASGEFTGCQFDNVFVLLDGSISRIQNCRFINSASPIFFRNEASLEASAISFGEGVTYQGISLAGSTLHKSINWKNYGSGLPYFVLGGVTVNSGAVLTIETGAQLFFTSNGGNIQLGSSSSSKGSLSAEHVRFRGPENQIRSLEFRYGSGGTVENCIFDRLQVICDNSAPVFNYCQFTHSKTAFTIRNNGKPQLFNSDFYNNDIALQNEGELVTVENLFWGHSSGPRMDATSMAFGETVQGSIDFTPWSQLPFNARSHAVLLSALVEFGTITSDSTLQMPVDIVNIGTMDLLVNDIRFEEMDMSAAESTRFWVLPNDTVTALFEFSSTLIKEYQFNLFISTNDPDHPELILPVHARVINDGLKLTIIEVDTSRFPQLTCSIQVTDNQGLSIPALSEANFLVKEDGQPRTPFKVTQQDTASQPISAVLVIDRSGSMQGQKIIDAQKAASEFVRRMSQYDAAAVISFSDSYIINQEYTSDKGQLYQAINALSANGGTNLFDPMYEAIHRAGARVESRAVILLSDGEGTGSQYTYDDVVAAARNNLVNIFTIGIGENSASAGNQLLSQIAQSTGGRYFFAPKSSDLQIVYAIISGQLKNRYEITYQSANADLTYHLVSILVNYQNSQAEASRGYGRKPVVAKIAALEPIDVNAYATTGKKDGMVFWYFRMLQEDNTVTRGAEVNWELSCPRGKIVPESRTFANGMLRLAIDMNSTRLAPGESLVFTFSDQIEIDGWKITLTAKPAPIKLTMQKREFEQSWDFFAAGSAGLSGTIGSIGAGPSVAMAKLSVKGKGGMGLEVVRDQDGIFEFTRRFESGVATDLKIPSANTVVGEVNVGGKADIVAKQIAGQTIRFDDLSKPNEVQMARAGFLLETMSLAGVTMSPIAGLLIAAIVSTLNDLAGVSTVMDRYQTELYTGTGLEGSVGVDFSVYLGKKSLIGFNFLEAMQRVALNDRYVTGLRAPASYRYEFHTAHDFDLDLFKFSIKPLDKSEIESDNLSLLSLGVGSEASYECTFDANRQPLTYRLTLAGGGDVDIFGSPDFSRYSSAELVIPTDLLSKITAKGGGVAKITRAFDESEKIALPVGPNALLAECQNLYGSACDLTEIGQLPAYLQFHDIKGMGEKVGLEISLDAALGAGLGFSLGIESNYFEERDVVSQKSVLLPPAHAFMVESNAMDIPANELMTLKSLLTDWLSGAALLVKSAMLNLWSKFEQAIEAARSFTVTVVDAGQKVAAKAVGLLSRAGRFVIIRLSPASNRILYKAFEEPVVKNVYFSNRVSTGLANQTPAVLTEDATVYMVSDNYALNFYPNSGGTVAYFNGAVDFSISVENEFMDRLGFTTSDKSKVRMFYYHDSTHTWIRLDSDFNASADTVACRVLRAGSYALGIEVSPSDDKQAPDIRELYPPEGATVPPDAVLKARLIDQTTGSGLAVAECKLLLDGKELATIWDSANELLFSEAVGEMDAGPHQLQVVAVDQNGNTSTVFSHFIVSNTGVNLDEVAPLQFRIVQNYPNPFNNHTKIFYYIPGDGQVKVMIFDERGRHVVTLSDQMQNAGDHQVEWDGTDSSGRNVPTGVYFYQIRFGDKTWVKKMSCIR